MGAASLRRHAAQLIEQLPPPSLVALRESRAVHSGPSAECLHAQAAVVRERPQLCASRAGDRLGGGVLVERLERLFGRREPQLGKGGQLQIGAREDLAHFDQLSRIGRRDKQLHLRASCAAASSSAAVCSRCSSFNPFCASATISFNCCGVNGCFSAVPCTSSNWPWAFATTFMSTSAAKSSS